MSGSHQIIIQALEDLPKNFTNIHDDIQKAVADGKISKQEALTIGFKVMEVLIREAIQIALVKLVG